MPSVIGFATFMPGASTLARMPAAAISIAMARVKPMTPCFAVTYASLLGTASTPACDEILTITPERPLSFA